MDSGRNNFLCKNDFHVIMAVTEADVLQNDDELNLEINTCTKNIPSTKKSISQCEFCDQVCFERGIIILVILVHLLRISPYSV